MSPHPSFSSSSFAKGCSCASPHPSTDVGDAVAGSSAWKRGWALKCVAVDGGATPCETGAARERHRCEIFLCKERHGGYQDKINYTT
jgi:hypothetical protein